MSRFALSLALVLLAAASAPAAFLDGVAVFGGAGATINTNVTGGSVASNGSIVTSPFATIDGVAAGGNLTGAGTINNFVTVGGNIAGGPFGFSGVVNGPINAGGTVGLGGPGVTATGGVTAGGGVNLQFATVNGNVLSGGNVSLNPFGVVNGSVTANGSIANSGTITGTATPFAGIPVSPVPYAPISLTADAFSAGGPNVTTAGSLAPGSYGNLSLPVFSGTLTLSAGDYFFNSFNLAGAFTTLNFDLTGGAVNVFVTGAITIGNFLTVTVNGAPGFDGALVPGPNPAVRSLASQVFFETLGSATVNSTFFGTLYAPNGNIAQNSSVVGSLIAGGTVTQGPFAPVFYVGSDRLVGPTPPTTAVPEPASVALAAAAGLAAGGFRRLRRSTAAKV